MSPASQGILEVERYIGSCLISSGHCRGGKQQERTSYEQPFGTWAGGAPLISMAPRRGGSSSNDRVPLSRLAVHTQGAPLILTGGRYPNGSGRPANNPARSQPRANNNNNRFAEPKKSQKPGVESAAKDGVSIDSLSIASDESSGSNNSENSLPRIIKPRKRRKKDRKPPPPPTTTTSDVVKATCEEQQRSVVVAVANPPTQHFSHRPAEPPQHNATRYPGDYYKNNNNNNNNNNPNRRSMNNSNNNAYKEQQQVVDSRQRSYPRQQVKVLDDNRNVIVPIPLCQGSAKANYCSNAAEQKESPLCYCDSATLIWAPEHLHNHGHHHHHHLHHHQAVFLRPFICPFESSCPLRLEPSVLRRSWSDPTSYFSSDEIVPNRDVGVIGDSFKGTAAKSSWRGDSCSPPSPPAGPLEVSTEIVTSPNGHRDLEIKFYSSSPSTTSNEPSFSFPEEDNDEELWRYHETKLQQDFRTLLQAGED